MTGILALHEPPLNPAQRAVWAHFQEGGSATVAAVVLLAIVFAVFVAWWSHRRVEPPKGKEDVADPWKVFNGLQRAMELQAAQRNLLGSVAQDLHLPNPSVLLLSRALFDRYVDRWQAVAPLRTDAEEERATRETVVVQLRNTLFDR